MNRQHDPADARHRIQRQHIIHPPRRIIQRMSRPRHALHQPLTQRLRITDDQRRRTSVLADPDEVSVRIGPGVE